MSIHDNNLKGTHEISGISLLCRVLRGIMVDVMVLVARVSQEPLQLVAELVGHSEVERTEIRAERFIDQVFVDTEEEGIGLVAGRLTVADPE